MTKFEQKISELIDWGEVQCHTDIIEPYIGKMHAHKPDYTGDFSLSLEYLTELFKNAWYRAADEIMKEMIGEVLQDE
jgi:hypothetical protein